MGTQPKKSSETNMANFLLRCRNATPLPDWTASGFTLCPRRRRLSRHNSQPGFLRKPSGRVESPSLSGDEAHTCSGQPSFRQLTLRHFGPLLNCIQRTLHAVKESGIEDISTTRKINYFHSNRCWLNWLQAPISSS